jgi:hypothetical protein
MLINLYNGPCLICILAALVENPVLTPPSGVRSVICRIAESSKATFMFGDVTATKFLMPPELQPKGAPPACGLATVPHPPKPKFQAAETACRAAG